VTRAARFEQPMAILFLTTDLLFSSRVAGAAQRLGTSLRTVATPEALLEILSVEEPPSLVLLDLNAFHWNLLEWVPQLRGALHPPQAIVAYGPHVHSERLAEATAAGCDEVLTRGQFNAQMDAVLARRL
jgi:CheY-like chemotaxis protein